MDAYAHFGDCITAELRSATSKVCLLIYCERFSLCRIDGTTNWCENGSNRNWAVIMRRMRAHFKANQFYNVTTNYRMFNGICASPCDIHRAFSPRLALVSLVLRLDGNKIVNQNNEKLYWDEQQIEREKNHNKTTNTFQNLRTIEDSKKTGAQRNFKAKKIQNK